MTSPTQEASPASSNYRWIICGLLFFATTFNYLDRQVISFLKEFFCRPQDAGGFGWSNTDFAYFDFGVFSPASMRVSRSSPAGSLTKLGRNSAWRFHSRSGPFLGSPMRSSAAWSRGTSPSAACLPSAKREIFPPRSKPSPNGFPSANARWPRPFSTAAPMPARWSRRCSCRGA